MGDQVTPEERFNNLRDLVEKLGGEREDVLEQLKESLGMDETYYTLAQVLEGVQDIVGPLATTAQLDTAMAAMTQVLMVMSEYLQNEIRGIQGKLDLLVTAWGVGQVEPADPAG